MQTCDFITKWQASTRPERAGCQEHFINLCCVLDEPRPNAVHDAAAAAAAGAAA